MLLKGVELKKGKLHIQISFEIRTILFTYFFKMVSVLASINVRLRMCLLEHKDLLCE